MEKLNIAEILKDCPKGMELDCTMFENVKFNYIKEDSTFPIRCFIENDNSRVSFNEYGEFNIHPNAKCVIFPKSKTTWEGFQRPFKDGDILIGKSGEPFIFKRLNNNEGCYSYCGIDSVGRFKLESDDWTFANSLRFATEEEKEKLFKAIKDNGYRWNTETKTLEKLPKFKVGDRVKQVSAHTVGRVVKVDDKGYYINYPKLEGVCFISFMLEKDYELLPNKFDITTLKSFDKVLVRDNNEQKWTVDMFSFYDKTLIYPFNCIGHYVNQCIPYESNQHLLGTTNDCDDFYKTWE